jgi:cation diffusion facilitator family transporter
VIVAAKHSDTTPDDEHPYGHARIETVATAGLAVSLMLVSAGIAYDAVSKLFEPENLLRPGLLALSIALVSVVSKEAIYHYTKAAARRLRSNLLHANAWHSRSDAASSVVAAIGIGGTMLGLDYLDAVAAVVVAWMVGRVGWRLARESIHELIDTGLASGQIADIKDEILAVDGVEDLHMLRTRQMAGRALVDVHINLEDPRLSASEAHHISEQVRARLIRRIDDVEDVTVHTDIEDDHDSVRTDRLPPRAAVVAMLRERWKHLPSAGQIRRTTLHYVGGQIEVELELPLELAEDREQAEALREAFAAAVRGDADIAAVRILLA